MGTVICLLLVILFLANIFNLENLQKDPSLLQGICDPYLCKDSFFLFSKAAFFYPQHSCSWLLAVLEVRMSAGMLRLELCFGEAPNWVCWEDAR